MSNKETLEQAAEKYAHNYFNMHETNNYIALKQGYEAGAKDMAERMYSEEDMQEYAEFCVQCYLKGLPCIVAKDWDEQLRKK
jgi:hypothetical protein